MKITLSKYLRLFETVEVKDKDGRVVGKKDVRREVPLKADARKVVYLQDDKGTVNTYFVSQGQIINPKKYQKRRDRKDRHNGFKLWQY